MQGEEQSFKEKYMKLEQVAAGTYGVVYKAKNIQTKQLCAVKKFKNVAHQGLPTSAVRQINALKNLQSDYLLPILNIYSKKDSIKLVMPWKELTLTSLMNSAQSYNPKQLIHEIIKAAHSMHIHHFAHRDLKPSNIVLDHGDKINLKLIDLGMARQIPYKSKKKPYKLTIEVGTLYYRAPQLLTKKFDYDFKIDVWSIGCIFYELLTKKILFKGKNEIGQLSQIYSLVGSITDLDKLTELGVKGTSISLDQWKKVCQKVEQSGHGEQQINLLKMMLQIDPSLRSSCEQILQNKYFHSIEQSLPKQTQMN